MESRAEQNAVEFGRHVKHGGWELGLLVACSVKENVGNPVGRTKAQVKPPVSATADEKISLSAFVNKSGVKATSTVKRYLDTWNKAAADGVVTPAAELNPADVTEYEWNFEGLDWSAYFDGSRPDQPRTPKGWVEKAKSDPKVMAELLSELPPADIAKHVAGNADAARAVARNTAAVRKVDDIRYEDQPTLADVQEHIHRQGRAAANSMNDALGGGDLATDELRHAASAILEASYYKEEHGVDDPAKETEMLKRIRRNLLIYEAKTTMSEEDLAWATSVGIDVEGAA